LLAAAQFIARVNPILEAIHLWLSPKASMTPTLSAPKALPARPATGASTDTWNELVAALPIVIFYRAVRELLQHRAHKRAVLEAFRR
jgi:hypothetical protein